MSKVLVYNRATNQLNPRSKQIGVTKLTICPNIYNYSSRLGKLNQPNLIFHRKFNLPLKLVQSLVLKRFLNPSKLFSPISLFKLSTTTIGLISLIYFFPGISLLVLSLGGSFFVYKGVRFARTIQKVLKGLNPNPSTHLGLSGLVSQLFPSLFNSLQGSQRQVEQTYTLAKGVVERNIKQNQSVGIRQLSSELIGLDLETQLWFQPPHSNLIQKVQVDGGLEQKVYLEFLGFCGNSQLLFKVEAKIIPNRKLNTNDLLAAGEPDEIELIKVKVMLVDTWQEFSLDVHQNSKLNLDKSKVKLAEYREL